MADFEIYSSNVGLQLPPVAPQPTETVQSVLGKKLQSFGISMLARQRATSQLMKRQEAVQAGQQAGAKLGFQPIKQNTEADILYNNAAMNTQRNVLKNTIRNTALQYRSEELSNTNVNSLDSYDSKMAIFTKTTLGSVSPQLQQFAKNNLAYYGITNRVPVANKVALLHKNIANSNLQLTVNNSLHDASIASFNGNQTAALAQKANVERSLDTAVATGQVTPSYRANVLTAYDKQIKFGRYEGQFSQQLKDGKGATAFADFSNANQKDLTPDEKQNLTSRFKSMMVDQKQAITAQYGNINSRVKDMETTIYLNGSNAATQGEVAKLKSTIDLYYSDQPEKATELKNSLDFAQTRHNFTASMTYVNPSTIALDLQEKEKELKEAPTFQKAQQLSILAADAKRILLERKADLYAIASQSPTVKMATSLQNTAIQGNKSLANGQQLGPATSSSLQDRDQALIDVEKQMGTPNKDLTIISKQELANLSGIASEGNSQQTMDAVQTLITQHINHRNVAMQDIQKAVPAANMMVLNGALNPVTRGRAGLMFQAADQKTKDLENEFQTTDIVGIKNNVRNAIMTSDYGQAILNRNGDPSKILNALDTYGYKLALVYKRQGVDDPTDQAVSDITSNQSQVGSYNGRQYVLPLSSRYDPSIVNDATNSVLEAIDPKTLRVPAGFFAGLPYNKRQLLYKNHLIQVGYPVTTTDNSGIQILDDFRIPVKTLSGQPFGFNFQDLSTPTSDIHKLMALDKKRPRILDNPLLLESNPEPFPTTSQIIKKRIKDITKNASQ
jgi:hypothetical protein